MRYSSDTRPVWERWRNWTVGNTHRSGKLVCIGGEPCCGRCIVLRRVKEEQQTHSMNYWKNRPGKGEMAPGLSWNIGAFSFSRQDGDGVDPRVLLTASPSTETKMMSHQWCCQQAHLALERWFRCVEEGEALITSQCVGFSRLACLETATPLCLSIRQTQRQSCYIVLFKATRLCLQNINTHSRLSSTATSISLSFQ